MTTRRATWILLILVMLMAGDATAQVFDAMDEYTEGFSTFMKSRMARAFGLIAAMTVTILAITTRGHGMEIGIAMLIIGTGLFFMFSADTVIFPALGFEP